MSVQELEHSVLMHGTKLRTCRITTHDEVIGLVNSIKHVPVNELMELVEDIVRVKNGEG